MPPSLTGTLVADAHSLEALANVTVLDQPFASFYIEGIEVGIPASPISPTDPKDRIRATGWDPIKGRAWQKIEATGWPDVRTR